MGDPLMYHGTPTGYRYGCRCGWCVTAHKLDHAERREQRLRARIDLLTDQRDEMERQRDKLAGRLMLANAQPFGACGYCGARVRLPAVTCREHADLPAYETAA